MNQKSLSKVQRLKEVLLINLLGEIPTIAFGPLLRKLFYRFIFSRIDKSVYIQNGVEFIGASKIEIGSHVHIFKGVRIDVKGEDSRITLEKGVALEKDVTIGALDNTCVQIGEGTFIGPGVCIAGPGDITIGKRCLIAAHAGIFANNHNFADPTKYIADQGISRQGIVIGDDCWLGHNVTVLDGVTIGEGSVIGAGAVVNRDIPPYSIAVGVPAKVIKKRGMKELVLNQQNVKE
ncbi:transferase [Fischerella major NIES-592]|uniref:Transferase n=1 Tax=Fischerella major NIES-592 TaxID=210994 RepID=A0A1U7GUD6_9CYAN|nr:acyltransferase [Fischerella major]OKH11659.1 transferase [Fischerella major NIES-592]